MVLEVHYHQNHLSHSLEKNKIMKNKILILILFLTYLPSKFYYLPHELKLGLLLEYKVSAGWFTLLYISSIQYMALAYFLWKPKGVDKILRLGIFIMTVLDFIHLILYAKQGFANIKILIVTIISSIYVFNRYFTKKTI